MRSFNGQLGAVLVFPGFIQTGEIEHAVGSLEDFRVDLVLPATANAEFFQLRKNVAEFGDSVRRGIKHHQMRARAVLRLLRHAEVDHSTMIAARSAPDGDCIVNRR